MKKHLTSLMIAFLVAFNTTFAMAQDCSKLKDDCEYYSCIEKQKTCGKKGYPLAFGKKYCLRFKDFTSKKMSHAGRRWLDEVRTCLIEQVELMPETISCGSLKNKALQSHFHCYYKVNFCRLSKRDKFQVIKTMKSEFNNKQIIKLGWRVLRSCKWF